ncbi:TPA: DUF551 domain-containing protein [Klebsiella aerogenes]|nr:DUF551 domain-containing protein [Klebsiella aerogenes]
MTNNQLTKEWLQQTIAELESVRDEIPFGIDTNSELELAAFKLALAAMGSEPLAYWRKAIRSDGFCYADGINSKQFHDENPPFPLEDGDYWEIIPLYRHAQPAPVVPDAATAIRACLSEFPESARDIVEECADIAENACRAAMLQDEPVTTANKLGNSPAIPDTWIPVSERMPEADGNYWGWWSESKRQGPVWFIKSDLQAQFQSSEITHWMPMPAAPQEVGDA